MLSTSDKPKTEEAVWKEMLSLKLKYKYIVTTYDCFAEELQGRKQFDDIIRYTRWHIIMEQCFGHLGQYFHRKQPSVDTMMDIMVQCCQGLKYLHSLKILHRDIKPANILLAIQDNIVTVKVSDYGLSRKMLQSKSLTSDVGTDNWRAPEQKDLLEGRHYGFPADIFSLGLIFQALLTCVQNHDDCLTCPHLIAIAGKYCDLVHKL
jgi:serine/threonine protein kinase